MKKSIVIILANFLFLVLIAPNCLAADVAGTVTAVDRSKGTVTVLVNKGKEKITLKVRPDVLKDVKLNERVKINYDKDVLNTIKKDRGPVKIPVGCGGD